MEAGNLSWVSNSSLTRLFSRKDGLGELYTYLPLVEENSEVLKNIPPLSIPNQDYGFSVGRGSFNWEGAVGKWVAVACRIKLNDIGSFNGNLIIGDLKLFEL